MKKTLLLLLLCLGTQTRAQDVIITKEGDPVKAYRVEVAAETVFYQTSEGSDATIQRMAKSDVLMIKFQDGRKLIIGEEELQSNPQPQVQPQSATDQDVSDPEANAALLRRYQTPVEYVGKPTDSKAHLVMLTFCPVEGSVMADKNIEVTITANSSFKLRGDIVEGVSGIWDAMLRVKNKSSKTLYLDLGNCFFIRGSQPIPFFVPTMTSSTHGTTVGGSVNLGAVAGAMGVGGGVGTLASGINVGGSNSNYSTTTVLAQRIVPIPPASTKELGQVRLMNMMSNDNPFPNAPLKANRFKGMAYMLFEKSLNAGQFIDFDPKNEMMQMGFSITYAEDELQTTPHNLHGTFGLSRVLGLSQRASGLTNTTAKKNIDELVSPHYYDQPFLLLRQKQD